LALDIDVLQKSRNCLQKSVMRFLDNCLPNYCQPGQLWIWTKPNEGNCQITRLLSAIILLAFVLLAVVLIPWNAHWTL